MKTQKQKIQNLVWEKITKPRKKDLTEYLNKYKFHELHIHDCLPPLQRSRVEEADNYVFMILTFPVYKASTKEVTHVELDFFIGQNYIITVQDQHYQPLDDFFENFRQTNKDKNPAHIVYRLLNDCYTASFPMLNSINLDIEQLEHKLFNGMSKGIIREILVLTRNIVNFRKSIIAHKSVLRKFVDKAQQFLPIKSQEDYYGELVNYTKEIWDSLDNYKDTIDALQQSHDSLYQWRLNEIIKTLTIVSIIIFTVTLAAALFSIEPNNGMPLIDSAFGWWKFIGIEIGIVTIILLIFRKKSWI